jgi:hypothetical protein
MDGWTEWNEVPLNLLRRRAANEYVRSTGVLTGYCKDGCMKRTRDDVIKCDQVYKQDEN